MALGRSTGTGGGGSGTLTTVKDEGTNLSTAVTSIDFVGAGVTATGTTAVTVTIPGATATAGKVLAYAFSNTTSGPTADSATDVLVPGLTTSFSLAATTVVSIRFSVRASKNTGYMVLSIYDNGSKLLPTTGGGSAPPPDGWYLPGQVNGGERQNQQGAFEAIISLASGSHQIDIYHAASANLNNVSWYERCVVVTQMA